MDESNPKESHTPWYRTARQTEDLFRKSCTGVMMVVLLLVVVFVLCVCYCVVVRKRSSVRSISFIYLDALLCLPCHNS